ncbi:MAG: SGNH/GDSL hydrolase family protein [Clostridia bacterium]|nr:SGNH/GDSL hydrolase family protein [Clostridia bacterium]
MSFIGKPVIDKYDLETWMAPIWKGPYVYNESVMFVGFKERVTLLYPADRIISVRSFDLKTEYKEGVDYRMVDGGLELIEGTSINPVPEELYYSDNKDFPFTIKVMKDGEETSIYFSEEICKYQVFVTYAHSSGRELFIPADESAKFKNLLGKLNRGEDVTMFFYGDSITFGASATDMLGIDPHTPIWARMFTHYLAKKYGYTVKYVAPDLPSTLGVPAEPLVFGDRGTITYVNPAVGGWRVTDGIEKFDTYIKPFVEKYGCDFILLAFGMNDGGNTPETEKDLQKQLLELVYGLMPDAEVLLLATMVPNNESVNGWYASQHLFEAVFDELADEYTALGKQIAVGKMTTMSLSILETKRFRDYTGNNINHPNDFMSRVYAQVVYATVTGE